MLRRTYRGTRYACYFGFITQAIVNNLAPLLFIIFQERFRVSYSEISVLVMANFITQLLADVITVKLVKYTGYRTALVLAHLMSGGGLLMMGLFPLFLPQHLIFFGLLFAVICYAVGGGIIEVLVSPTVENLPGDAKAAAMSLLHSFYCWGQMGVVLISTVLLQIIGHDYWWILPVGWSLIGFGNALNFSTVPIITPPDEEKGMTLKDLLSSKFLLALLVLMTCAGASELAVTQWASLLVETSLDIPKVWGDLLGPCMFALIMGCARTYYGMRGEKLKVRPALTLSAVLCIIAYLLIALAPHPVLSLVGCSLCGLSVAVMWPGTFSLAAATFKRGGTVMFALLAVFGDLGCAGGPGLAGLMSDLAESSAAIGMDNLRFGILCGTVFPVLMLVMLLLTRKRKMAIE